MGAILCEYRYKRYIAKTGDSLGYISVAESIGLSSTTFILLPESYRHR